MEAMGLRWDMLRSQSNPKNRFIYTCLQHEHMAGPGGGKKPYP